ncbi:synaptonemal complex protein 2-like isoform X2 [Mugil cephalus]|uniref:synaptonemal complex protein 2-like isoform X2 n=1 Tax=Mugil cephalus TaxID=48193 RepID=UPI001FB6DB6A|nr:synaptonemal complex protein 2-like isoform X2 [Mugil cephalus]
MMFEVKLEDCLLRGDSTHLVSLLHYEGLTTTTLTRLDQLVTKELCESGFSRVLVVLKSLGILSRNKDDIQTLITFGLTPKVLLWFEAVRDVLTSDLQRTSPPLMNLVEEFFDFFLLLGQASLPVPQVSVVLLQLAQFVLETQIHFPLRLEAIRTFNSILESLSREQRRLIQNERNQTQILSQVAAAVLTVGDYELQVSLSEALCRLTPRRDRQQRANQWFSSRDISNAFCDIRDADFEVDCRRFLNFVNCYHGDQRRVYTFPCMKAFLNSTQMFRPKDEKLDEFWIDFNVGSGCVSFFIDEPQSFLWGSIHLLKEEVTHYGLQLKHDETVLSVELNNPIMHHNSTGQTVKLIFSCEHHRDLEEATGRIFMKVQSSPHHTDAGGTVQRPPSAEQHSVRSYGRKKSKIKSQLKILRLSSASSEEDSSVTTPTARSRAEILFDDIIHSTPKVCVPEGAELQTEEVDGSVTSKKEVFRKREAQESGYLSDHTEGTLTRKRRVEPQEEGEESISAETGAGSNAEEGRIIHEEVWPAIEGEGLDSEQGAEPESSQTHDITAAFRTFKAEVEKHLTGCWHDVNNQLLLSLKDCQQHVSSLLSAVHQNRLLLLQSFEGNIADQLKQLEENSSKLDSINSQILSFFQSQMQQLSSFCTEHLERLMSLDVGASGTERPSSQ